MTAPTVDVVELPDARCQLVIEADQLAFVVELDPDEAARVAGLLLDGGSSPVGATGPLGGDPAGKGGAGVEQAVTGPEIGRTGQVASPADVLSAPGYGSGK